jgi:cytochrome P450
MSGATQTLELNDGVVRLDDPAFYINDPFPTYARMRAERPVYWYEPLKLWALTRYEDISQVSRNPGIFSSEQGIVINDIKYDQSMVKSLFPPGAEHLMASDPPRHRVLRRMLGVSFAAKGVAALEQQVRAIAASLLDSLPVGEEIEFVARVAAVFPMMVLCAFMGISPERVDDLARWADATTAVGEPRSREEFEDLLVELGRCYQFFGSEVAARSGCPRDDVISSLLAARLDGEPLNEMTLLMFCQFLTAAAGETTRHLLTGALIALNEHPDEYARLRTDPAGLAESATEEFLRWVTPAIGFVRTAATDTMLSGQRILAGERVLMLYPPATATRRSGPTPSVSTSAASWASTTSHSESVSTCASGPRWRAWRSASSGRSSRADSVALRCAPSRVASARRCLRHGSSCGSSCTRRLPS